MLILHCLHYEPVVSSALSGHAYTTLFTLWTIASSALSGHAYTFVYTMNHIVFSVLSVHAYTTLFSICSDSG